ncbi:MAG: molybdopterin biosynthesis protein [Anaerolineae bacterium]|nr:molybdopterin biosynthesis protein [Anaerolineae bacterium]
MKKRNIYLEDLPLSEAWARITGALEAAGLWQPFPGEDVPLDQALGRVTAEPIWAAISAPHYHASAMDGYAVRARDTVGATESNPLILHLVTDEADLERVERPAQAANTGAAMPPWADAVIMVEHVQPGEDEGELIIREPVVPWRHIRMMGEDMVTTELVLPANHALRPVDLGALAGSGHASVSVRRRPRVAIIPTGSELVPVDAADDIRPGQIIEYNSLVLATQVETWDGVPTRFPIVPDEYNAILAVVRDAARDHDLVLVNAGSSAGTEDWTAQVVRDLGEVLVHGVAVRPGHPVVFGMVTTKPRPGLTSFASPSPRAERGRPEGQSNSNLIPIIGVPGYPVSTALTGEIFVEPILSKWLGRPPHEPLTLSATLSRKIMSPPGDDDYARVTVGQVGKKVIATPLARGAGVITSLVRADGIIRIPRFSEGLDAGAEATVHLYRPPQQIARTIVHIGSHDMTLDLLAQFLAERFPGMRLSSANVGSLGGLIALKRGEAHLAGSHLLDPGSGEYNWKYIDQYLPGQEVVLITLVGREQGLIVPQGNPIKIASLDDLARPEVAFVNRQRGAGTRLLLDYELGKRGIEPEQVKGYKREEYTHLAVAAAVAGGTASCGLGIRAAAQALGLDFISVGWERYDLVFPQEFYEDVGARYIMPLLDDETFRAAVAAMEGYDVGEMGQVVIKPMNTSQTGYNRAHA